MKPPAINPQLTLLPQQQQGGLMGLLSNPMFTAGMGLLSAGYDSRINPYSAALQGMSSAQQTRWIEDKRKREKEMEAARRGWLQAQADRIRNAPDPTAPQLGTYNPRDYTAESWKAFVESQDPGTLKRYEPVKYETDKDGSVWAVDSVNGTRTLIRDARNVATTGANAEAAADDITGGADIRRGFNTTYPQLRASLQDDIRELSELKNEMAKLPTGPGGEAMTAISAKYQAAFAKIRQKALEQIGNLAEQGVKLNPITEKELEILFSTSPQLTNFPEANVEILESRISKAQSLLSDLEHQKSYLDSGKDPLKYEGKPRDSVSLREKYGL